MARLQSDLDGARDRNRQLTYARQLSPFAFYPTNSAASP